MAKRAVVGLIYSNDQNWIGGTYYIENLILALFTLSPNDKPFIKLFCSKPEDATQLLKRIPYPYISVVVLKDNNNLIDRLINKISYTLINKHLIVRGIDNNVDVLFPASFSYLLEKFKCKIFWVPDFQDLFFPKLFNVQEIEKRKLFYQQIAAGPNKLILSSQSALRDWNKFYKKASTQVFVMPFAVTLPSLEGISGSEVIAKYRLPPDYFICSNQFWAHKNIEATLYALKLLKEEGVLPHICFTGNTHDRRNPDYFDRLQKIVDEHQLSRQVSFLGFIDRTDQLVLMKSSVAIIQPSKFEGWSTVVEDAKALQKEIILSDIAVHREQLPEYEYFFTPDNPDELARLMMKALNNEIKLKKIRYNETIEAFAANFLSIIKSISY